MSPMSHVPLSTLFKQAVHLTPFTTAASGLIAFLIVLLNYNFGFVAPIYFMYINVMHSRHIKLLFTPPGRQSIAVLIFVTHLLVVTQGGLEPTSLCLEGATC